MQEVFNREVQEALRTTVYNAGGCVGYYLDANGRNSTLWPWSAIRMTRRIRDFSPADYVTAANDPARTPPTTTPAA